MKKIYLLLLGLLGLHLLILVNLQFTAWPEMFSFPYMVNKGFLIYKDFHHAYQPLLTIILSFIYKVFGYNLLTLQIFTWSSILLSDVLIFLISEVIFGKKWQNLVPVLIFVILQPFFEGNMLWFDLATVPVILTSFYFLFKKKWFFAGFVLALGILIKQQLGLLLIGYFVYFLFKKVKFRDFIGFTLGGIIPVAITFLTFLSFGIFNDYLFWTFIFPLKDLPKIPGYATWPNVKQIFTLIFLLSPIAVLVKKQNRNSEFVFLLIILLMSFLSALPRFSYFHLQPMLAIYSIFIGVLIISKNRFYLIIFPILVFIYVLKQNLGLFGLSPRFYNWESQSLANIVKTEIKNDEEIYFLGPNSLIYVLSNTIPPKPWIENYVWHFEIPGMQEKMISGWQIDPPMVIFWTDPISGNWFDVGTYIPQKIAEYIHKNYFKIKEVSPGLWEWRIKK